MKKIFIILLFIFGFQNTFATETTYDSPTGLNIGLAEDYRLSTDNNKKNTIGSYVCSEMGYNYISSELESCLGTVYFSNDPGIWEEKTGNRKCFKTITCTDVGLPSANEGLNADADPLNTDLPVFVVNQGVVYINKDNFLHFIMLIALTFLLFKTVINIFSFSFGTGKNLTSGKLKINKK